jgi:hypothetical protein
MVSTMMTIFDMPLYVYKYLMSKFSIQKNPVPVACVDVPCVAKMLYAIPSRYI